MEKFILKEDLADFVTKMWESGIKCDLKPRESRLVLWSDDLDKMEHVDVVEPRAYKELVREIECSLLPIDNGLNTIG